MCPMHGYGRDSRIREGDYCLVTGQEDPRSRLGHVVGLNIEKLVRDTSTYHLYDRTFKSLHDQGEALAGFTHIGWGTLPSGLFLFNTAGAVDFADVYWRRER